MHEEWLELLRASLRKEKGPPLAALATVDETGHPHVRCVVCHIEPNGEIWFGTSSRSSKNRHIAREPRVELVFWTAATGRQFRIEGLARPIRNVQGVLRAWQSLSDDVRAFYYWPASQSAHRGDRSAFPAAVPASTPPAPTFEPIIVRPRRVEMLSISVHPHERRAWSLEEHAALSAEELDP